MSLKALGPGLITGASDDDPSGIGTYSQAGAQLGYGIGWTMLLTFPLMAAIQEISARVGRVTGHGISGNVCRHYSPWLLNVVVALLFIANTINIAADLGAMADATKLLIGGHGIVYVLFFGVTSVVAQIFLDYKRYVVGAEMADAQPVRLCRRAGLCQGVVGRGARRRAGSAASPGARIISPPSSRSSAPRSRPICSSGRPRRRPKTSASMRSKQPLIEKHYGAQKEFHRIRADTIVGMAFSNLIALSIIVTAAATLHAAGKTDIQTSAQAAEALRPIAGAFAEVIFALGIVGTGLLAIPVLAGATAYAVGEGRRWPVGLARKPKEAVAFYAVLALSAGDRHRAQFHPDQSDLGAVLERRRQRRARRARDGAADVHGAPQGRDGPLRDRRPALLARMAVDRGDAAQRAGDGRWGFLSAASGEPRGPTSS